MEQLDIIKYMGSGDEICRDKCVKDFTTNEIKYFSIFLCI